MNTAFTSIMLVKTRQLILLNDRQTNDDLQYHSQLDLTLVNIRNNHSVLSIVSLCHIRSF
jgi:hypothetical protein